MLRLLKLRTIVFIGLFTLIFVSIACSNVSRQASAPMMASSDDSAAMGEEVMVEEAMEVSADIDGGDFGSNSQASQSILDSRKVIRNADMTIIVEDTQTTVSQLRAMAGVFNGYVADASLWQVSENLMRGNVTLRIDARQFDEALDRIKELALEVRRENIGSQDVTQEYTDLTSRLRNLEATEQELLALLTDIRKRTNSADEILQVYRELTQIRDNIEQIKGRVQFLDNRVNLATINITLIPKEDNSIVQPGWQPGETFRDALSALVSASQGLVNAMIWLVVFAVPVLIAIAVPIVLIIAGVRRMRRQPAGESA